ncbi:MAG: GNAT family N-acetyltransferase [Nitriliruptoraceae bacterium]|nr:GNAT family N-acetyltransferase [Nitriliruptoraceae bacterium]
MPALSILPVVAADLPFVRAMLHEAAFWRDTAEVAAIDDALREPGLARYVEGWGRPGDAGLVARRGDTPVGAVWVRRFPADAHGYGFVDERTPELSIAVSPGHRRLGTGRCLLDAMLVQLRWSGVAQVSLSVEDDNPALRLYEQAGFAVRDAADGARTMVRLL